MDITLTPAQLLAGILALCAGVSCVAAAVSWVVKGVRRFRAPDRRQDERLAALEARMTRFDRLLETDKRRLDAMETGSRVTQRAILALLAHGIDGNEIEAMRAAKNELQDYLIKRS